jgi:hypothetical protein
MIDDTELEKLRYQQMKQNSEVRRIELNINQAWKNAMYTITALHVELSGEQYKLRIIEDEIAARGARPDDRFPSALEWYRSDD